MKVILTHDNTDFDALAAMLAASKVYAGAVPIVPGHPNRNVRDFLTLYWEELPFKRIEDLPRSVDIEEIILVDTQTLPKYRGIPREATLSIIDHHPMNPGLPPDVAFDGEELGATTTLFVEKLSQSSVALTPIEATLCVLGIYEDTGSLSYVSTTPRDVRAAAWLLEKGASLEVVNDFLRYPLTPLQHDLYDRLNQNLETFDFSGQSVIIARAHMVEYVEEISVLAHHLQDLYQPDALFLLVSLGDHIQMVARSTTSAINVADIAAVFDGGGHSRAAAALIRDKSLDDAYHQLIETVRIHASPRVTVRQIMSFGVHTLSQDATVKHADIAMRRYGHEGFPVVDSEGQIVGILTRPEIDRALHHHLGGAPIRLYMHPGRISVAPGDPVERVQQVMMEHGLGQVPVVEDGQIIGIVTRTDLIKLWSEPPRLSQADRMVRLMEGSMPAPLLHLLRDVGLVATEMGSSAYLVGGVVRDLLLGIPNLDLDIVVEGDAIELAQQMTERNGGRVRSHSQFGTAKWLAPEELAGEISNGIPASVDFVTARTEFYEHPTALPQVERSSIRQDLHRRDFTINTLAICLDPERFGDLLDYFGGEKDLQDRLIRVLHSLSFVEDPTRMLRAVRLEQRLRFRIEERTAELIGGALGLLDRVSGERIRHELYLIFNEEDPVRALRRLEDLGILTQIHPALRCDEWFVRKAKFLQKHLQQWEERGWASLSLRNHDGDSAYVHALPEAAPAHDVSFIYMALFTYRLIAEELDTLVARLKMARGDGEKLHEAEALRNLTPVLARTQRASTLCELLKPFSSQALFVYWVATDSETIRGHIELYQRELRYVMPEIDGSYLKESLGIPAGPIYGRLLAALRNARLDGQVSSFADELRLVKELYEAEQIAGTADS